MDDDEARQTRRDVSDAVNMSPRDLEAWLETEESRAVGDTDGGGESTGHEMGRHIVELRHTKASALSDEDLSRMRKVVGYVHRHLAQRPEGDVTESRWRYSLMNWGHDPLRR